MSVHFVDTGDEIDDPKSPASPGVGVANTNEIQRLESERVLLEQRVLESLFLLGSAAFALAFFSYWLVLEKHLSWLDALYFTMGTFTTIS